MPKRADKIPCQGGDEYDWLDKGGRGKQVLGYRKWLRWLKRKYNKRLRKEVKHGIKDQMGCVSSGAAWGASNEAGWLSETRLMLGDLLPPKLGNFGSSPDATTNDPHFMMMLNKEEIWG